MDQIHIITRVSKLDFINQLIEDTSTLLASSRIVYKQHLLVDVVKLESFDIGSLSSFLSDNVHIEYIVKDKSDPYLHTALSRYCRDYIRDGWIVIIDDDNKVHENLLRVLNTLDLSNSNFKVYVGHQDIDYKDFTKTKIREATPENMKVGLVDIAQAVIHYSIFQSFELSEEYRGDGIFLESIFQDHPGYFYFIDSIIAYYNFRIPSKTSRFIPTILYIGEDLGLIKTVRGTVGSDSYLNVIYRPDDSDFKEVQNQFNIDLIVSETGMSENLKTLNEQPIETRRKWVEVEKDSLYKGNFIYGVYITTLLEDYDKKGLVSFFTSTYNSGQSILKTYHSIKEQFYDNWEWVVVDDSSEDDKGETFKIIQSIAQSDSRVKAYSLNLKSNHSIGEAKYRAATLCTGEFLVELDHDDLLTPDASSYLIQASNAFPEAGFFYSDSVEVNADFSNRSYGENWAFGYGTYREEFVSLFGTRKFNVPVTPPVNPKTIRHIVSSPNHFRAWRRDLYFKIGGHNRRLNIVDDYELMIRTFLETRMVYIPKTCYIQVFNGHNSQDLNRPEISRRVDAVRQFYNVAISKRFRDLNIEDWCDSEFRFLNTPFRPDSPESRANLVYAGS